MPITPKRNYPSYVPGKELHQAHFFPFFAAKLDRGTCLKESKPLLDLAQKRGWITSEQANQWTQELHTAGNLRSLWEEARADHWNAKIGTISAEEAPAFASWLFIQTLMQTQRLVELHAFPALRALHQPTTKAMVEACKAGLGLMTNLQLGGTLAQTKLLPEAHLACWFLAINADPRLHTEVVFSVTGWKSNASSQNKSPASIIPLVTSMGNQGVCHLIHKILVSQSLPSTLAKWRQYAEKRW